jgi:hypothetical protein
LLITRTPSSSGSTATAFICKVEASRLSSCSRPAGSGNTQDSAKTVAIMTAPPLAAPAATIF